jgi:GNAT superfamily N-acetyltransferase
MDGCERIVIQDLTPDQWPDLEKLFGSNGACGGCWCQWWRIAGVEHWKDVQGEVAHGRLCRQVQEGSAHGVLAFEDGEPVGWCSFEQRSAFPRLQRSPSFKGTPTEGVWFVGCFFIRRGHRHRGIAELLLSRAVEDMGRDGARVIEACPKDTHGRSQPDAFVYTGTRAMFERQGFQRAETSRAGIAVMRRRLRNQG